jgi:magnesium transporter
MASFESLSVILPAREVSMLRRNHRNKRVDRRSKGHKPEVLQQIQGAAPLVFSDEESGGEHYPEDGFQVICTDISDDRFETLMVDEPQRLLQTHRPEWSKIRWIHIQGELPDPILEALAVKYHLHPLAVEDIQAGDRRPKVEDYAARDGAPGRLFIISRELVMRDAGLRSSQINLFLGRNTLLTFQDRFTNALDPVYKRLEFDATRSRLTDASLLCHSIMDAVINSYFPVLEHYSFWIDEIEEGLLDEPSPEMIAKAHGVKRGLLMLRRTIWPMREVVSQLQRQGHECLSVESQTYFRDIYDHCVQILDLNETYHEIAVSLTETYMSVISNRMNEIVKVLTMISTIFIPLSFIAGVYGMNMPIPENDSAIAYPIFWLVCLSIAGGMLVFFRRKGWI